MILVTNVVVSVISELNIFTFILKFSLKHFLLLVTVRRSKPLSSKRKTASDTSFIWNKKSPMSKGNFNSEWMRITVIVWCLLLTLIKIHLHKAFSSKRNRWRTLTSIYTVWLKFEIPIYLNMFWCCILNIETGNQNNQSIYSTVHKQH